MNKIKLIGIHLIIFAVIVFILILTKEKFPIAMAAFFCGLGLGIASYHVRDGYRKIFSKRIKK